MNIKEKKTKIRYSILNDKSYIIIIIIIIFLIFLKKKMKILF